MLKQFQPRTKIHWHWKKYKEWRESGSTTPVMFEFDPSEGCNHDCIWCSFDYYRYRCQQQLSREIMFKALDGMKELNVNAVNWTGGGEPLTNPHTPEGLKYSKLLGLENGLYSNGGALNSKVNEIIIDACRWLRISLDAGTANTHSVVHRVSPKVFPHILEQMKDLVKLRKGKKKTKDDITLGAGMLVHPFNYGEIVIAAQLVKDIGFDYFQVKPVVMNTYHKRQIDREFWTDKVEPLLGEAEKLSDENYDVIITSYKFEDLKDVKGKHGRQYGKCFSHCFMGTIGGDGKVYLCCHHRGHKDFVFGDLHKNTLKEIWYGKQRQEAIKRIDLDKCHILCKNHVINKELWENLNPKKEMHPNFL